MTLRATIQIRTSLDIAHLGIDDRPYGRCCCRLEDEDWLFEGGNVRTATIYNQAMNLGFFFSMSFRAILKKCEIREISAELGPGRRCEWTSEYTSARRTALCNEWLSITRWGSRSIDQAATVWTRFFCCSHFYSQTKMTKKLSKELCCIIKQNKSSKTVETAGMIIMCPVRAYLIF